MQPGWVTQIFLVIWFPESERNHYHLPGASKMLNKIHLICFSSFLSQYWPMNEIISFLKSYQKQIFSFFLDDYIKPGFDSWVGKICWRRKWQPTPAFSPVENPMDSGAWQVTAHGIAIVGYDLVTQPPPPPHIKLNYRSEAIKQFGVKISLFKKS